MKLWIVNLRFSGEKQIDVSIILNLPTPPTNHSTMWTVKNNLAWMFSVLDPDVKFEVVSVIPFIPEQHMPQPPTPKYFLKLGGILE